MSTQAVDSARRKKTARIVCIVVWIMAFAATHAPACKLPQLGTGDKTMHFVGYFVLITLLLRTLRVHNMSTARRAIVGLIVACVYGAFDELTQPLVNRCAAWSDWVANILGASGAILLDWVLLAVRRSLRGSHNSSDTQR